MAKDALKISTMVGENFEIEFDVKVSAVLKLVYLVFKTQLFWGIILWVITYLDTTSTIHDVVASMFDFHHQNVDVIMAFIEGRAYCHRTKCHRTKRYGQNVTRINCHRIKFPHDKMLQNKMSHRQNKCHR